MSLLSFTISSAITKDLIHLAELLSKRHLELKSLNEKEKQAIMRYARISNIGASTRIENAVLTDSEIDWLDEQLAEEGKVTSFESKKKIIVDKLSKDRERSIQEVAGCRAMLALIYNQWNQFKPLTESYIGALHQELLSYYPKSNHYRGIYKKNTNSVVMTDFDTGKKTTVFETAPPGPMTSTAMADLVGWYNHAIIEEPWTLSVACEFVFRFLAIHPFQDGNGRLGRGLFLLSLLHSPSPVWAGTVPYMAIDRHIERNKEQYYHVLNQCSQGKFETDSKQYKIEHFLNFMIKILLKSIEDIDVYKKRFQSIQLLSPTALKVLDCFKDQPETRLRPKDIVAETGIHSRTLRKVLKRLLDYQLIQRYGQGPGVRYQLVF